MNERIFDIKKVARYIALSLLTKQMTVSPLKLQKLLYYATFGVWCSLVAKDNCLQMFRKHG